uniref:Uncharacterized protein n=1 Tax=Brassica oleracea TaxID=3712 RepID=A0A3P6AYE5_BRAOL|nr:unnamed protein product [Brassica oleracea]
MKLRELQAPLRRVYKFVNLRWNLLQSKLALVAVWLAVMRRS